MANPVRLPDYGCPTVVVAILLFHSVTCASMHAESEARGAVKPHRVRVLSDHATGAGLTGVRGSATDRETVKTQLPRGDDRRCGFSASGGEKEVDCGSNWATFCEALAGGECDGGHDAQNGSVPDAEREGGGLNSGQGPSAADPETEGDQGSNAQSMSKPAAGERKVGQGTSEQVATPSGGVKVSRDAVDDTDGKRAPVLKWRPAGRKETIQMVGRSAGTAILLAFLLRLITMHLQRSKQEYDQGNVENVRPNLDGASLVGGLAAFFAALHARYTYGFIRRRLKVKVRRAPAKKTRAPRRASRRGNAETSQALPAEDDAADTVSSRTSSTKKTPSTRKTGSAFPLAGLAAILLIVGDKLRKQLYGFDTYPQYRNTVLVRNTGLTLQFAAVCSGALALIRAARRGQMWLTGAAGESEKEE